MKITDINECCFKIDSINQMIQELQQSKADTESRLRLLTSIDCKIGSSKSIKSGGYSITLSKPITFSIDRDILASLDLDNPPVKHTVTLDKKAYNALDKDYRDIFDESLTSKHGKEAIKVTVINNK